MDQYVSTFCTDCIGVLKKHDERIRNNLLNSEFDSFYEHDIKGIGIYSVTEPVLKFLIYGDLCKKYQIWSECSNYYTDRKLLDIALASQKAEVHEEVLEPDIAIEMKWAKFTKDGKFYKWSADYCVDDLHKLHKKCLIPNKYVMQFAVCDPIIQWCHEVLKQQILDRFDKRRIKGKDIKFVFGDSFDTCGSDIEERQKFNILLWKIE